MILLDSNVPMYVIGREHPLKEVARRARDLLASHSGLSARDALHAAVMEHHGIPRILTFDHGFDGLPGIERVGG